MPRPVHLHSHVGRHDRRELLTIDAVERRPEGAGPTNHAVRIVAADEVVVGDIEVARARVVREDAGRDVLETGSLHREPLRADDELGARPNGNVGIAKRQSFEIGVIGRLRIEQREVPRAVENGLAVARTLDGNGTLFGAVSREVVRAVEWHRTIYQRVVRVFEPVVFVQAGVHENRIAWLDAWTSGRCPIGSRAGQVVGAHQAFECRLDLRAFESRWVDVKDAAGGVGLRLSARTHRHHLRRNADDAVRIGGRELHVVRRVWLEVEHATGKHVGRNHVELLAVGDALVLHS